jgi:isopenicillin N synthase-like dioxygenase
MACRLQVSCQALFEASQKFFDLPVAHKQEFETHEGSEEGWNLVAGEKEFITLRTLDNTPKELKEAAASFWAVAGAFLNRSLGHVAETLDLPSKSLTAYSEPCITLGKEKTATLLRLFRYEGFEGRDSKTVAEGTSYLQLLQI